MKVQMVAFLLFAITFHQVPSMSVPASFDPEYAHGPVDLIPLESDSGSTENDDDDEELGNVVVISFDDENTFEVMKISSDLEAEILAQKEVETENPSTADLARRPKWIKKVEHFVKKIAKKVKLCISPASPVMFYPCITP